MRLTPWLGLAALAVGAGGCDPKAESDYEGEVITSIRGVVNGEKTPVDDPEQLQVTLSWSWYEPGDDPVGYAEDQIAVVTAEFPFGFRIDLLQPPTELNDLGGTRMSIAWMYVLDGPYPGPGEGGFVPFYAMADAHMLAYLEDDAPPDSLAARFLGGPLPAGFHVMQATARTDCSTSADPQLCEAGEQADLSLAADDLDTLIPLLKVDVTQGVGDVLPYPWVTLAEVLSSGD